MAKLRHYSTRDVEMLTASRTIAESFKASISELSPLRSNWSEQYAADLVTRIDQAMEKDLGLDKKKSLRDATASLGTIQAAAKRDLNFFKTQIRDDYRNNPARRDEVLTTLGFNNAPASRNDSQEALTHLLFAIRNNLSDNLRKELTAKGITPALLDNIIGYAVAFQQANTRQESYKESTKQVTKAMIESFNAIYDEVISISKLASIYYRYDPLKREQFTFQKILKNLGGNHQKSSRVTAAS